MSAVEVLARLAVEVAEDQWGLVTRAQALAAGVPPATFARLVAAGALVRVAHGVYRIAGGSDPGHLDLRAAWLQLDPLAPAWQRVQADRVAVVSHRSAAELYDLGDLIADTHEFSVPVRTQTRRRDVRMYLRQVPPGDREVVGGLPVTRAHRIVADLLDGHEDGSAVATIAVQAVRRGLTTVDRIAAAVAPLARRYHAGDGAALANQLLSDAA
ncbi:type IV toxin-antitoxin system AbiEi family antitoxin domain-containing protein [Dactylosporangium sp. CA-092794]|uniref:type IV toxin-antitoxin system AbiEi family antitoxin domain-containing protein n=1 Tax=Dactylosporangium sp. CA-092794 TaxID=3239929 RepID=UPI003D8C9D69